MHKYFQCFDFNFVLIFIIGLQFGGYTLYRLNSKTLETQLKYKSSVVRYSEKSLKGIAAFAMIIAVISFILLFVNYYIEFEQAILGFLPPQFLLTAISALPF